MAEENKLCILCCRPFEVDGRTQIVEKLSQFCEEIYKSTSKNKLGTESDREINFYKSVLDLDNDFRMSVCIPCLTDVNEMLTSNEQRTVLENHVISLQREILKGLRDLDKCLEKIKWAKEKLKNTVKGSDELNLRKRLPKNKTKNCVAFKLREYITDVELDRGKLKGNLSIPETKTFPSKPNVNVKDEVQSYSEDEEDTSNPLWDFNDDVVDDTCVLPIVKIEKLQMPIPSRMTLRTRSPKKTCEDTQIPKSSSIRPPLKRKKKKIIKKTPVKLTPQKKPSTSVKPRRYCNLCPFNTKEEPCYEQHIREHEAESTTPKTLECPDCPSKFSTDQYFQFHQKCHQGYYKMFCDICHKQQPIISLADHLKSHFPSDSDQPKIIYCQNCSFCCSTRNAYLLHLRRHVAIKIKGKFPCGICSVECPTQLRLLKHYHEKHEGTLKKWTCHFENCNKSFPGRHYLVHHLRKHNEVEKVPCPECHKLYKTKALMEVHYRIHSGEMRFACNLCDQKFRWQNSLVVHQRNDHGAPKLKCKVCEKEYCDEYRLRSHMANIHENKGLPCETCGKTFGNKHALKNHMDTHGDENGITCDQCGKGFKATKALQLHMKIHSGVKNHKCEYCGKGFVRRENLRDHLRIHTGERPFVCEICGKDFNQVSALKTHKKNQHPNPS